MPRNKIVSPSNVPQLAYQADPIRESLKILGRKWMLLIIRDIAFLRLQRFGKILRNNPGLTPRVLSRRLAQMQREGLVKKKSQSAKSNKNDFGYYLTPKGEDAVYILLATLRFGLRHYLKDKAEGKSDEERIIKGLHYDLPSNWLY